MRHLGSRRLAALAVACLVAWARGASAETGPRQVWTQLTLQVRPSPRTTASLELQKRWEASLDTNRLIFRPIVLVSPRPWVNIGGGYNYQTGSLDSHPREHRVFQHLQFTIQAGRWSVQPRLRVEERFIEDVEGISVRMRLLARATRPIGQTPWAAVLSHEVQVTANETGGGPRKGLDRHRSTVGLQRRLPGGLTLETSYMLQSVARTDRDYRFDSNLFVNATKRF